MGLPRRSSTTRRGGLGEINKPNELCTVGRPHSTTCTQGETLAPKDERAAEARGNVSWDVIQGPLHPRSQPSSKVQEHSLVCEARYWSPLLTFRLVTRIRSSPPHLFG